MSETKTDAKYSVKLVYYGRADLVKQNQVTVPQVGTQNIRIVAFSSASSEDIPEIAIYELVANKPKEEPVSDIEGTKIQ